jgi:hypothetical protein
MSSEEKTKDIKELLEEKQAEAQAEIKKRGRPKKEKTEKPKKAIGRPKSETDIKTRRLLYGLTFFSKILGLTDEEIENKKTELLENIKSGKVSVDSFKEDAQKNEKDKDLVV